MPEQSPAAQIQDDRVTRVPGATRRPRMLGLRLAAAALAVCAPLTLATVPAFATASPTTLVDAAYGHTGPHPVDILTETDAQTPGGVAGIDYLLPADVTGPLPAVTMVAGFGDGRASVRWLAERLASHGVLVQLIDPPTSLDPPSARARALVAAHAHLLADGPVSDRVDPTRLGLWGYSMGGGGALEAARSLTDVRAVVAVFPWDAAPSFPTLTSATLVVAGERDGVAIKEWYARPAYASLATPDRGYAELADATHPLPSHSTDPRLAQMTVAWFLDRLGGDPGARSVFCPGPALRTPVDATTGYSAYSVGPATCS